MSMSDVATHICFEDDGTALGVHGQLVIAVIDAQRPFSAAAARWAVDEIARMRRTTHKRELVYTYVMGADAEVPGPDARQVLSELPEHIDAAIGMHEGTGFRASMVRAVVTGIAMASRARVHPEIVATIPAAAARIRARLPNLTEEEIVGAIERVRAVALDGF
jgi:hypothetical protein